MDTPNKRYSTTSIVYAFHNSYIDKNLILTLEFMGNVYVIPPGETFEIRADVLDAPLEVAIKDDAHITVFCNPCDGSETVFHNDARV